MRKKPKRPASILYGVYDLHDSLCFLDERYARALDAEVTAVKTCTTYAQAMAVAETVSLTRVPGLPEDVEELEDEDLTPDSPYDWSTTGEAGDGDWPGMPTGMSLNVFEEDDAEAWDLLSSEGIGAEVVTTTFSGDYLHIPTASESALREAFEELGIPYVRDDRVIGNLGMS